MRQEVKNFSEILNIPGVWFELCFDDEIGVWDISSAKYFVTQNKKSKKYAWDCCYTLN